MISITEELSRLANANVETAAANKAKKKTAKRKAAKKTAAVKRKAPKKAARKAAKAPKAAAKKAAVVSAHAAETRQGQGVGKRLLALLNKSTVKPSKMTKEGVSEPIDQFKLVEEEARASKAGKATKGGTQAFWFGVASALHEKGHDIKPKTPVTILKEMVKLRIENHKFVPAFERKGGKVKKPKTGAAHEPVVVAPAKVTIADEISTVKPSLPVAKKASILSSDEREQRKARIAENIKAGKIKLVTKD